MARRRDSKSRTRKMKQRRQRRNSKTARRRQRRQRGGAHIPKSIPSESVVILDLDPKDPYSVPVVTSVEEADEAILDPDT